MADKPKAVAPKAPTENLIGQPISKGEKDTGPYGDTVKVPEGKVQYTHEETEARLKAEAELAAKNQDQQVSTAPEPAEPQEKVHPGAAPVDPELNLDHPVETTSERVAPEPVKTNEFPVRKTSEDPNPNASHDPADNE